MSDILQTILRRKAEEVSARRSALPLRELQRRAKDCAPTRAFQSALEAKINSGQNAVIAEVKKASPSKGVLRANFVPVDIAQSYQQGGAACLSVLTDVDFFQGHDDYLRQARGACQLPILRKDFVIDAYQIYEARALGADCILLIVSALADSRLAEFTELGYELNLDVLIEVHDAIEMRRALETEGKMIGVNNRNLRTFAVDLQTSIDLKKHFPKDRLFVTESGVHSAADVARLKQADIHTFLVGEAFMRKEDPGAALASLFN
jgi:indole-3-glycerol phosphate synthase